MVFDTAYKTNDNLLICAPTGAGKTNIAMLCVLHELKQHLSQGVIKKDEFKVRGRAGWSETSKTLIKAAVSSARIGLFNVYVVQRVSIVLHVGV